MYLRFSKNELIALRNLSSGDFTTRELASQMGKKDSYISRMAQRLESKGFTSKTGQKHHLLPASHAQSFRQLCISRPSAKLEQWLCGYSMAILVLASFSQEGIPLELFWKEVPCSKPTAYLAIKRLRAAGAISQTNGFLTCTDREVAKFANDYADNIVRIGASMLHETKTSLRVRLHALARANENQAPPLFAPTGLNILSLHGLEAMRTDYNDYYFSLAGKKRKISLEEAFIHALAITLAEQQQDKLVLALFLQKNRRKMSMHAVRELAKQYNIFNLKENLGSMLQALDYAEKIR